MGIGNGELGIENGKWKMENEWLLDKLGIGNWELGMNGKQTVVLCNNINLMLMVFDPHRSFASLRMTT